jgi:hypothetical protein
MATKFWTAVLLITGTFSVTAQAYASLTSTIQKLYQLKSPVEISGASDNLNDNENIPVIEQDSVASFIEERLVPLPGWEILMAGI